QIPAACIDDPDGIALDVIRTRVLCRLQVAGPCVMTKVAECTAYCARALTGDDDAQRLHLRGARVHQAASLAARMARPMSSGICGTTAFPRAPTRSIQPGSP